MSPSTQNKISGNLVFATGGTGGHIYPALACADIWSERHPESEITFIGTRSGMEGEIVSGEEYNLILVSGKGVSGKNLLRALLNTILLLGGLIQALYHLKKIDPVVVVGMGGYASFPAAMAGVILRYPVVIHEENLEPGGANKVLMQFADRLTVSFKETLNKTGDKGVYTGNPVRLNMDENPDQKDDWFDILVFGGSRGSAFLNRIVPETLPLLEDIKDTLRIRHQTGGKEKLERYYQRSDFEITVDEYIYDMGAAYSRADLVICRAGATTISELRAAGKPAILIPFSRAAGGHQLENAKMMEEKGCAVCLREESLTPETLAETIKFLYAQPSRLKQMSESCRNTDPGNAGLRVVKEIERLCTDR